MDRLSGLIDRTFFAFDDAVVLFLKGGGSEKDSGFLLHLSILLMTFLKLSLLKLVILTFFHFILASRLGVISS